MSAPDDLLGDPVAARLVAFDLVRDLQAGSREAAARLTDLLDAAESHGHGGLARLALFGLAVDAWITQDPDVAGAVKRLVERSEADGDDVMLALGLSMRATFGADREDAASSSAADDDLARAAVILEKATGGALELVTAHTGCGIAFGFRSLWELADEQYGAALRLHDRAEPGARDAVLGAVVFNRAEAQVDWACTLRELGHPAGVAQRWEAWHALASLTGSYDMPEAWHLELGALGLLMAAVAGQDVAGEVRRAQTRLNQEPGPAPNAAAHLALALALSEANAGRPGAAELTEVAVAAVEVDKFPQMYELALCLAAELEASSGAGAGLRYARRQAGQRWADRLAKLGSMRSRMDAERLRVDLDRLEREATIDELTGIGNRRALTGYVAALRRREARTVAVLMADIDGFKGVNDRHGHQTGDAVLARLGQLLEMSVRAMDLAVRLGGDEFLVAMADADLEVAHHRAATLLAGVDAQHWDEISPGLEVRVSIGAAAGPRADLDALMARADEAVYEAKRAGGHAIVVRTAGSDGP